MVDDKNFEVKESVIREFGTLQAYHSPAPAVLDFKAGPMSIYLVCLKKGNICLQASFIPHPLELNSNEAIFLANPRGEWEAKIIGETGSEYFMLHMDAGIFHQQLNPAFEMQKLDPSHRFNMRDLMRLIPVSPAVMICFDQLLYHKLTPPYHTLYEKGKALEILSLLLDAAFGQQEAACPVMITPVIEHKLNLVRRHIMANVDEVPDPDQLSLMFDLPKHILREGYRYKYGKTIHQYHADHKLDCAMQMLTSGEMLVKEVAFKIGYQNPSHFISAFKKKFGFTPKQYLKA